MATPRKPKRVNASYLKKDPSEVHEGFASYIEATTGTEVPAATVALVQRLYPLYLKSPAVVEAREKAKAEREAEEARKQAEKQRRVRERLAKIEAQRAKLLADLGLDEQNPEEPVSLSVVPDPEVENELAEVEDNADEESDGEPESEEVTLEDDSEEDEDEDLWDDEDEDEAEDF